MTTLMNEKTRELSIQELECVVGGLVALNYAALNPQPIPPGRVDFGGFHTVVP